MKTWYEFDDFSQDQLEMKSRSNELILMTGQGFTVHVWPLSYNNGGCYPDPNKQLLWLMLNCAIWNKKNATKNYWEPTRWQRVNKYCGHNKEQPIYW